MAKKEGQINFTSTYVPTSFKWLQRKAICAKCCFDLIKKLQKQDKITQNHKWTALNAGVSAPKPHWGNTHSSHIRWWSRVHTLYVLYVLWIQMHHWPHRRAGELYGWAHTCILLSGPWRKVSEGWIWVFSSCRHLFQIILKPENPYLSRGEEALMSWIKEATMGERWKLKIISKPNNRKKNKTPTSSRA